MARTQLDGRALRHCASSPRRCLGCVSQNARLTPVLFILVLLGYAYAILVFSFGISYLLLRRRRLFAALVELVLSNILLGGAALSLLITVIRAPGSPKSRTDHHAGVEEGRAGPGLAGDSDDQAPLLAGERGQGSRADDGDEGGISLRGFNDGAGESDAANGISARSGHTAPLLTSGPTSLLPGQPRLPARTDRDQLVDQLSLAERLAPADASRLEPPSQEAEGRPWRTRSRAGSTSKMSDLMIKSTGQARWCNKCAGPKPDRAHHCSTCGVCVLRMDHHCPWLGGCVGLRNHKAFFLFLTYTSISCVYAGQESARALLRWINEETNGSETTPITWAILLLISFIFGLALLPFAGYHAYLLCKNKTTIESMEGGGRVRLPSERLRADQAGGRPNRVKVQDRLQQILGRQPGSEQSQAPVDNSDGSGPRWKEDAELTRQERKALKKANKLNVFDVGAARNWRMMMGQHWWQWLLPWGEPDSDGFSYHVNKKALFELDRITYRIRTGLERPEHSDELEDESDDDLDWSRRRAPDTRSPYAGAEEVERQGDTSRAQISVEGRQWESGHGRAEWGPPPRQDFVLYDGSEDDS